MPAADRIPPGELTAYLGRFLATLNDRVTPEDAIEGLFLTVASINAQLGRSPGNLKKQLVACLGKQRIAQVVASRAKRAILVPFDSLKATAQ